MAARARDALTNIYYKKRKMKETVYHPAFIMLGGGMVVLGLGFVVERSVFTQFTFFFH